MSPNAGNDFAAQSGYEFLLGEAQTQHASFPCRNYIGDKGASALAGALQLAGVKLDGLGLGDNLITDKGATHLAEACGSGKTALRQLHLFNNSIADAGAIALAHALGTGKCKLHTLDLSRP